MSNLWCSFLTWLPNGVLLSNDVSRRKYGHNETDQPSFTQPLMYRKIAELKSALDYYTEQLIKEKTFFQKEDIDEHKKWC